MEEGEERRDVGRKGAGKRKGEKGRGPTRVGLHPMFEIIKVP